MVNRLKQTGFTIIELLIVIVVIGILATLVLNTFRGAQNRARVAKAEKELQTVETAILALGVDVGKWPNGCPIDQQLNPEVNVELASAGLASAPPVGVVDTGCEWTTTDVNNWKGPYLADDEVRDGWGNSYIFDPDYYPWQNCGSMTTLPVLSAVVSHGEDGTEYSCDDIYRVIGG